MENNNTEKQQSSSNYSIITNSISANNQENFHQNNNDISNNPGIPNQKTNINDSPGKSKNTGIYNNVDTEKTKNDNTKINNNNNINSPISESRISINNKTTESNDTASNIFFNNLQIFTKYKCLTYDVAFEDSTSNNDNYQMFSGNENENDHSYSFRVIANNVIKLSFPTIFFYLLMHLQQTICLSFLGKTYISQEIVNGYGVIMLYINCALSCITTGIVSGLDTLLPNAWAVSNFKLFNVYIQRAKLLTIIIGISLSVLHMLVAIPTLRMLGASDESLIFGSKLLPFALIACIFESQFSINFVILAVLNRVYQTLLCLLLGIIIHLCNCYLFITINKLDITGAGLSMVISQCINYITTTILIYRYNKNQENQDTTESKVKVNINQSDVLLKHVSLCFTLSKETLSGLFDYMKFIFPNTILLAAEWMAFEIQGIFALKMTNNDYSVHLILANLAHLTNTFSCGFSMAVAILVAEKVGKLLMKKSKFVAVYTFIIAQGFMSLIVILIILCRNTVFRIFTDNIELMELGRKCIIYLAIFSVVDATQSVMAGVFRGYGKQNYASFIALIQYYFVQTIFSLLFGFYFGYGVVGIWISILLGAFTTTVIYFIVFQYMDFEKIKNETKKRLENDSKIIEGAYSNLELMEYK